MKKITSILFALIAITAVAQSFTSRFPAEAPTVGFQFVPAYTNIPWTGAYPPEATVVHNGATYVVSKTSMVTVVTNLSSTNRTLFLNGLDTAFYERDSGMPGLAFHPNGSNVMTFASEVRYVTNGATVATNIVDCLRRRTIDPTNPFKLLATNELILEIQDRSSEHLGGALQFDQNGYLLLTLSDEGEQDGVLGNAQKINGNFFSGVIRIDLDGRPGSLPPNPHPSIKGTYWVPSDNPWVGATNFNGSPVDPATVRTEFWAVGLRNPHTMVKDSVTGRIFIGDVGNRRWESIFELQRGANYGWNWMEGPEATTFTNTPPIASRPQVQFTAPFWTYPHNSVATTNGTDLRYSGECVFAGVVYHGSKYPTLDGKLISSDYNGNVWAITITGQRQVEWIANHPDKASSWFVDPFSGDIMCSSFWGKAIYRMIPASYTQPIPATLTETGVFTDVPTFNVNRQAVLPYNVANPFWSDGAIKERWFYLPPGGFVSRDANDDWSFPAGTFWMKHFNLGGRLETRFLVKTASGAYGLTYKWRPDGLDADLVPSTGESLTLASGQPWRFPGWSECSQCHNGASGAAGFSTRQLNTTIEMEGSGWVNQLEEFSARGLIYPPILSGLTQPVLSTPGDTNFSIAHRFKSYVDANCAYCHYPDGPGRGTWDARFKTPLNLASIVNGAVGSDLGYPGGVVISPGDTNLSVLHHRIADWTPSGPPDIHMPPLGTFKRNDSAVSMVAEFIASLDRKLWQIGTNGPVPTRHIEFPQENRKNDPRPGSPIAIDDDYYTAGTYPSGFNGLTNSLTLLEDESWATMERANTISDRTNRIHLVVAKPGTLNVNLALWGGGWMSNKVVQSGFYTHAMTMKIDDQLVWTNTVTSMQNAIGSLPVGVGPHTIEVVRHGPNTTNTSAWISWDYLQVTKD